MCKANLFKYGPKELLMLRCIKTFKCTSIKLQDKDTANTYKLYLERHGRGTGRECFLNCFTGKHCSPSSVTKDSCKRCSSELLSLRQEGKRRCNSDSLQQGTKPRPWHSLWSGYADGCSWGTCPFWLLLWPKCFWHGTSSYCHLNMEKENCMSPFTLDQHSTCTICERISIRLKSIL